MKFLIEECRERTEQPDYTVAEAESLQALLTQLKAELLAYHPYDNKDADDGLCVYDYWSIVARGRDEDQVHAVNVYPLGEQTQLPLDQWGDEWQQTRDAEHEHARETRERRQYALLHAKYGDKL